MGYGGGLGQASKGSHATARASPPHPALPLGLALEVPSQDCGHRLGYLTSLILKAPEHAIMVLEGWGWGAEKVGEEQARKTQGLSKGSTRHPRPETTPPQGSRKPKGRCSVLAIEKSRRTGPGGQARAGRMLALRETLRTRDQEGTTWGPLKLAVLCTVSPLSPLSPSLRAMSRACRPSRCRPATGTHLECRKTNTASLGLRKGPCPACPGPGPGPQPPPQHPSRPTGVHSGLSSSPSSSRNGYALAQVTDTDIYVNPKTYDRVGDATSALPLLPAPTPYERGRRFGLVFLF